MQTNRLLVLVDIDGTLLTPGGASRQSLSQAIFDITGREIIFGIGQLAGLTDPLIVKNALKQLGFSPDQDGLPGKILERYIDIFQEAYPLATDKKVYSGINDLLEYLKSLPARIGLLTGNIRRGAQIKLKPFDLWRYFEFGVFGDDNACRNELPPIALERVKSLFDETYRPEQVIVIGDTLNDVTCAHVNLMQSVVVLRHPEWRAQIEAAQPELLIENFEPLEPIKSWFENFFKQD